jgi:hypothetical protein
MLDILGKSLLDIQIQNASAQLPEGPEHGGIKINKLESLFVQGLELGCHPPPFFL